MDLEYQHRPLYDGFCTAPRPAAVDTLFTMEGVGHVRGLLTAGDSRSALAALDRVYEAAAQRARAASVARGHSLSSAVSIVHSQRDGQDVGGGMDIGPSLSMRGVTAACAPRLTATAAASQAGAPRALSHAVMPGPR